jgi:hypothetical protein
MQRYQFTADFFRGHATYGYHTETLTTKSRVLAGRMKEHAKKCKICCNERRLNDPNFYGVYK